MDLGNFDRSIFSPAFGNRQRQAERFQGIFRSRRGLSSFEQRRKKRLQLQAVSRFETVREIFKMIETGTEVPGKKKRCFLRSFNHDFANSTGDPVFDDALKQALSERA